MENDKWKMANGVAGFRPFSIFHFPFAIIVFLSLCGGCVQPARVVHALAQPPARYHIHLPGIGGYRGIDRGMLRGLQEGGLDAELQPYDWTQKDPGLGALLTTQRHTVEAARVAKMITELVRAHPDARVTISCHSGGAGIIIWALEQSPEDVKVDAVLLLSPALSPNYDLSKALRHVRRKVYSIYSPYDVVVLGVGTRMLGTIDGVKMEAAGKVGFAKPQAADAAQYEKLVQVRYDSRWVKLGNIGDHIGSLARPFARKVLAALLLRDELPVVGEETDPLKVPATLPSGAPTTPPAEPVIPTTMRVDRVPVP
jgi:pimeloyl-ACP methyl ester carboxylesterase